MFESYVSMPRSRTANCGRRIFGSGDFKVSFEFFPPRTATMTERLWKSVKRLEPLCPTSVAVTYGIEADTRARTHALIARLLDETTLSPTARFTCVGSTRQEVDDVARSYWNMGVRRAMALRGDPPGGAGSPFVPRMGGYSSSVELIKSLKAVAPFEICVAVHPEKHPDSASFTADLDMLQAKIDAGATSAVSQLFFDNDAYFRFLDRAHARGIFIPIIPGIAPIHDFRHITAFCERAGVSVPHWLHRRFSGIENDRETRRLTAAATCAEQVLELARHGISEFHFYTLNRDDLVYAICHMLGLRPADLSAPLKTN